MSEFDLLEESVERRKIGTYVSCDYTITSAVKLQNWCDVNHIPSPLASGHYHSTILYSRKAVFDAQQIVEMFDETVEMKIIGFKLFDSADHPEKCALVLELEAPLLIALHERLIKAGGTHDYNDYTPHVTVSYDAPSNLDLSLLKLPDFVITINSFKAEPLDLNWKE